MRAKTQRKTIRFVANLEVGDIAESLAAELTFDEMHELIVELDRQCQDWSVTQKLYKYFAKEMEKFSEATKDETPSAS